MSLVLSSNAYSILLRLQSKWLLSLYFDYANYFLQNGSKLNDEINQFIKQNFFVQILRNENWNGRTSDKFLNNIIWVLCIGQVMIYSSEITS